MEKTDQKHMNGMKEFRHELGDNECFVFGTNLQGFHGAGGAGLALRGDSRNNWRQDKWFMGLVNKTPGVSPIGKWAVYGVAKGFMQGEQGCSYGVVTVTRPGAKRSITRKDIYYQLVDLWTFANDRNDLTFLISPLGEGYAGYTKEEMNEVWTFLIKKHGLPENIHFIRELKSLT